MNTEDIRNTGRILWLDALRVFSCLGVVAIHIWSPGTYCFHQLPRYEWMTANCVVALVSWCVPMFVMISGALLLSKPSHHDVRGFFARRARLFWQTVFWTLFFSALRLINEKDFDFKQAADALLNGAPYYHMWFLYMIIGLYAITPLLSVYIRRVNRSFRLVALAFIMLASVLWAYARALHIVWEGQMILTVFVPFVGYYLLGYELINTRTDHRRAPYYMALFLVAVLFLMFFAYLTVSKAILGMPLPWLHGAFGPLVLVMSVSLFRFFNTVSMGESDIQAFGILNRVFVRLAQLSPLTLGIYIIHPLFVRFLVHVGFVDLFMCGSFSRLVTMLFVLFWSGISVWAISRIPYIRGLVTGSR